MASILFVYPPPADPTGPYLSIPYLAAACRARGHQPHAIDLNLESWLDLLSRRRLSRYAEECRARLSALPQGGLAFPESSEYLALSLVVHDADRVADRVEDAVASFRDRERFHDPEEYERSFTTLQRALALVSARFHPLELNFTGYQSPFYLNDAGEIERESGPAFNPFHPTYLEKLLPEVARLRPAVLGISATFNAQLLQAFAIGRLVKEHSTGTVVVIGGTAITQLVLRNERSELAALSPYADLLVLYEGEETLSELLDRVDAGRPPQEGLVNVVRLADAEIAFESRPTAIDISSQPPPEYGLLPLDRYLSPELVLYVAPTRGCYWEKCAFCHYGLTDKGTAPYRRVEVDRFVDGLAELEARHGARFFYFSGDLIDPAYLFKLAQRILERGLDLRFTSDLRIERSFSAEKCRLLKAAGMVAAAFGTESDSPRLLKLMDKGTDPASNRQVFESFSSAGIAVQAMTFLDFPTETTAEAHATLDLLEENIDRIDLFFVEQFDLEAGSRVFRNPQDYGVAEVFHPAGDRFRLRARHVLKRDAKRAEDYQDLASRLERLAAAYGRRPYPYAGSVSVAHTLLYFDRKGRGAFKDPRATDARRRHARTVENWLEERPVLADGLALCDWPYDLEVLADHTGEILEDLERRREMELRDVGREAYAGLVAGYPGVEPCESYYLLPETGAPVSIPIWLWMLLSCLDGETTVREAARSVEVPLRQAVEAMETLYESGYVNLPRGMPSRDLPHGP
ncbi:MAG: radical SAM protein [Planctomycetota bacterium]